MSHEQLISQPSRLPLPSRRASKFPKWNAVKIAPHPNACALAENPRLCPSLLTTGHSPFTVVKGTRKLENSLTRSYSATSKFLIDNFHRHFAPAWSPTSSPQPGASAIEYQYSNRQSYEKLEVGLSHSLSTKVLILIDTKTYFVQGKNAQFQCTRKRR